MILPPTKSFYLINAIISIALSTLSPYFVQSAGIVNRASWSIPQQLEALKLIEKMDMVPNFIEV